jgi:hypothetical protein
MEALVGGGFELVLGLKVREVIVNESPRRGLKGRSLNERIEQLGPAQTPAFRPNHPVSRVLVVHGWKVPVRWLES